VTSQEFQDIVWQYGRELYRDMPWRDAPLPYYVWVSELMLQQTQVARVIPKFNLFIARFPTVRELAAAPLADVLIVWNGLGYNRRAKYLWEAAQVIMENFQGELPSTHEALLSLPGIGPNTAAAICNYAYQVPQPFIETNIRTVYFHHWYDEMALVSDKELLVVVAETMDREQPREWFWALMDYGSYLKKTQGGRLNQSIHYKKQSPLKGSVREMRGQVIRQLAISEQNDEDLRRNVVADERYDPALRDLQREGLIIFSAGRWRLAEYKG